MIDPRTRAIEELRDHVMAEVSRWIARNPDRYRGITVREILEQAAQAAGECDR